MRIGIDLGGTKTEGIALADDGSELLRLRVDSPRGDYSRTVQNITDLVRRIEAELQQEGTVGVGIPGTIVSSTGLVKNANSTWLNGHPLQHDLSLSLKREVRCENDANCFAVSEASDGAAAGAGVVFGVILGTGCGGGIALHGRVHAGRNGLAGEWGHTPLPWPSAEEAPGPACYCGRSGCLETWISGTALERDFFEQSGSRLNGREIVEAAETGNRKARGALDRHGDRVARGLTVVVDIFDPDVIVLGGGLSNMKALYDGSLAGKISAYAFGGSASISVVPNRHGDSSGVRGAAWLWGGATV